MPDETIRQRLEAIRDRNAEQSDRGRTINEINDEADALAALKELGDAERCNAYGNDAGHPDYVCIRDPERGSVPTETRRDDA